LLFYYTENLLYVILNDKIKNKITMANLKTKLFTTGTLLFLSLCFMPLKAQVTIGEMDTPNTNAVLDLRSNDKLGMLLPRVNLQATNLAAPMSEHLKGMVVYNLVTAGTYPNNVVPGFYYNDGTKWILLKDAVNWFYLPSFNLDVSTTGPKIVNLFNIVDTQLQNNASGVVVSSGYTYPAAGAIKKATPKYVATDLAYIVTYYDNTVINNITITADGVMSYNVLSTTIGPNSYVNIICIVK